MRRSCESSSQSRPYTGPARIDAGVCSQLGILGYLAGPLAGGAVAEALGFSALGLVPLAAAAPVFLVRGKRSNAAA